MKLLLGAGRLWREVLRGFRVLLVLKVYRWVVRPPACYPHGVRASVSHYRSNRFGASMWQDPKDIPYRYTVNSGPARLLFVLSPAGFEEFIYATSEPAKERTLPPRRKDRQMRWRRSS
jgi:hypothetical protein